MKRKYILLTSIASLLLLAGCTTTDTTETPDSEVELFSDEILTTNMESLLDGFTLVGTVNQTRYEAISAGYDSIYGETIYESGDVLETNTYYTTVKYDNRDQNRFYKYSYREYGGVEIAAEGPYTYYEDEEGYAYTADINYTNEIVKSYPTSSGKKYNFAANGFYNFFTIFNDNDFTLDEDRSGTTLTYYNINTSKANVICNNIMYSLNSGAYSTIDEAYIMCVNGVFSQLYIDLTAIQSEDEDTEEVTLIDNTVTFDISDIGTTVIEEPEKNEETSYSRALDAVLDSYEDNFTIDVTYSYSYTNYYDASDSGSSTETLRFFYTGDEVFIQKDTSSINASSNYYLAPLNNTSDGLYPYAYDSSSSSWVAHETGYRPDESTVAFAQGYCGTYTYEDLVPMIADVSGTVFEYDENLLRYNAVYDVIADITGDSGFMTIKRPILTSTQINLYTGASTFRISTQNSSGITVTAGYTYTSSSYITYIGDVTIQYSNVGTTTLPTN